MYRNCLKISLKSILTRLLICSRFVRIHDIESVITTIDNCKSGTSPIVPLEIFCFVGTLGFGLLRSCSHLLLRADFS